MFEAVNEVKCCLFRKIPGGVFGRDGEMHLFTAVELPEEQQVDEIRRSVTYVFLFLLIISSSTVCFLLGDNHMNYFILKISL